MVNQTNICTQLNSSQSIASTCSLDNNFHMNQKKEIRLKNFCDKRKNFFTYFSSISCG